MRYFLIILLSLYSSLTSSQSIYYQDIIKGGITGNGGSTWLGSGSFNFPVLIPSGSTIKKAFLITASDSLASDITIDLNGVNYLLTENLKVTEEFISYQESNTIYSNSRINILDITTYIYPATTNYALIIPPQPNYLKGLYSYFYIYIVYENPIFPLVCTSLYLNNMDVNEITNYNLASLNPINITNPVGLEIGTSYFCDTIKDGSYVFVNENNIGLLGGSDSTCNLWSCTSPYPNFGYYNNTLYGLDDDTPDQFVIGTNATADIKSYINNFTTSVDLKFQYQSLNIPNGGLKTNPIRSVILNYTTPCSEINAIVSNDTTVCEGEELQLAASGGTKYEWKCLTDTLSYGNSVYGLNCKDCPNPVFSGNRSAVYTVRVWNGDSCSVVRPVRITVKNPPTPKVSIKETTCGNNDGYLIVSGLPNDLEKLYVITPNGDTLPPAISNTYLNLGKGTYSIYYTDVNGCKSKDTTATIESVNMVKAIFTATPLSGPNPLAAQFTNNSQYAAGYSWSINGQPAGTSSVPDQTVFDSSGVYQVQLVAIGNSPECTDTVLITILVYDSLVVEIPTVFSPNNDGVNDVFAITTNQPMHAEIVFFNRWGNEVFTYNKDLNLGSNVIWNGTSAGSATVTDGVYFYKAVFSMDKPEADCNEQKCELEKSGFVHIVR